MADNVKVHKGDPNHQSAVNPNPNVSIPPEGLDAYPEPGPDEFIVVFAEGTLLHPYPYARYKKSHRGGRLYNVYKDKAKRYADGDVGTNVREVLG